MKSSIGGFPELRKTIFLLRIGTVRQMGKWRADGKKHDSPAFSTGTPHSAPNREMATCGKILGKNCAFLDFGRHLARCGPLRERNLAP
jgi:hypothetical protein